MNDSYVKLNRNIAYWGWYKNNNTKALFLHCLIKANWTDGNYKGVFIPRGSFPTTFPLLKEQTGMTLQEIRTAIKHLKSTGELTVEVFPTFSLFTVNNYDLYQDNNIETNRQVTDKQQSINTKATDEQQTSNRRATTIKEYKNIRNKENNNIYNTAKEHEREAEELFNRLWKLYPRKLGKGQVKMKQKLRLRKIGYDKLAAAIGNYKQHIEDKGTSEDYIMYGSTFFNSGYVDFLPNEDTPADNETPTPDIENENIDNELQGYELTEDGIPIITDEMWANF